MRLFNTVACSGAKTKAEVAFSVAATKKGSGLMARDIAFGEVAIFPHKLTLNL